MKAPIVTINGIELTPGQVMTIRVAVIDFKIFLQQEGLGDDDMGKALAASYLENAVGIISLLTEPTQGEAYGN